MKKLSAIKCLAFLMMFIMALSVFAGCAAEGENGEPEAKKNNDQNEVLSTEIESMLEQDPEKPSFEETDYEGYEFTFICQPYMDGTTSYPVNYMVADKKGETQLLTILYYI